MLLLFLFIKVLVAVTIRSLDARYILLGVGYRLLEM